MYIYCILLLKVVRIIHPLQNIFTVEELERRLIYLTKTTEKVQPGSFWTVNPVIMSPSLTLDFQPSISVVSDDKNAKATYTCHLY